MYVLLFLQLADQHGVQFFETSAWANQHVSEPFECLASQILEDVSICVSSELSDLIMRLARTFIMMLLQ